VPSTGVVERAHVIGEGGKALGRVSAVLFHPSEARVVGVQIDPGPLLHLFERRSRFALLDEIEIDGEVRLAASKLPRIDEGERVLGYSWEETVVWHGMPVRSADGGYVGSLFEAIFDAETGQVARIRLSTGLVGDAAVGKLEVDGALVRGFDGAAIIVMPGFADIAASGGAAKRAAGTAAVARVQGERLAKSTLRAGAAAADAVSRSLEHGIGRKALDKLKTLMDDE
jgi:uncharacterized protein YrrD